ncbi:hypothetical protein CRE_24157 [Caenorhabditis remanei]|uniref:Sdz-33 F-box domain-containing protein n=1 Tax=Caenorhabditis remanei TaxID=31234 RepID=E3N445_CAERE|nr:hypothetical protein CRE_24157 [Caenorhabditis remanei]
MSSIKLLSFPLLIFSEIVRSMGFVEILELSQASRRMLNFINLARISVEPINIVNGSADKITIYDESCTERKILIEFLKTPQPVVGQMKVNNIRIDVCSKDATQQIINCNSHQFGYGLVHILTHMDKIFYRMEYAIGIELSTLNSMRGILCHSVFRKCDYMQIRGRKETLSNEDCEYLLEKTQPTTGISIFSKLSSDFDYKKVSRFLRDSNIQTLFQILHFSRLRVVNLGKMPLEDLKALDSEFAILGNHQFTETDINEFLHQWIEGNNRKLRCFQLDGFKVAPDWDILLKEIVHTDWNPRERERYYKSKYTEEVETIDCENGRDFRNKNGQLATVVHHSEFLDFLVCSDRIPE